MLRVAKKLNQLSFAALMEVYLDANREHGAELAPGEPEARQIQVSEERFYSYLHDDFFAHSGAYYCVWEENGKYVSALRLEPYRDGLLLEALETAPDQRGRGYAVGLIQAVQKYLSEQGTVRIYSHVDKKNEASLRTHRRCGFEVFLDYAAFIDGSVNRRSCTLRYEKIFSDFEKKN